MHSPNSFFTGNIYEGSEPYAFISYSHKDSGEVLPIVSDLNSKGLRVWYDEGIEAGSEWPEYLAEHLANSSVVVAFISGNFNESKYCRREMHFATRLNKPIICIYIDNAKLSYGLEMELTSVQGFKKENYVSNVELVQSVISVKVISTILVKKPEPVAAVPVQTPVPQPVVAAPVQTPATQPVAAPVQPPVSQPVAAAPVQTPAPQPAAAAPQQIPVQRQGNKPVSKPAPVKPINDKQPKAKRRFSRKALIITLCVLFTILLLEVVHTAINLKAKKEAGLFNSELAEAKFELLTSSEKKFTGYISEEMLIGKHCNVYLNESAAEYKLAQEIQRFNPAVKYVERMTKPKTGTAARSLTSSVPYYIECSRLIDQLGFVALKDANTSLYMRDYDLGTNKGREKLLKDLTSAYKSSTVPNSQKIQENYEKFISLYNTFYVDMRFYDEDGMRVGGDFEYIYRIYQNVMRCSRIDIESNGEIIYYNSTESYNIWFTDNILSIEAVDKSSLELIPLNLYDFMTNRCDYYRRTGYLANPNNAILGITEFDIKTTVSKESNTLETTATIHFKNGGYTTDAQVEMTSWGNLTISWYAVYHPDKGTTDAEPDSMTVRIIGDKGFFIVDKNTMTYNYSAKSAKA